MKIINQKVEHKKYGRGTVFALRANQIYVTFGKLYGDIRLPYPEAFREDMKLVNPELQEMLMEELEFC